MGLLYGIPLASTKTSFRVAPIEPPPPLSLCLCVLQSAQHSFILISSSICSSGISSSCTFSLLPPLAHLLALAHELGHAHHLHFSLHRRQDQPVGEVRDPHLGQDLVYHPVVPTQSRSGGDVPVQVKHCRQGRGCTTTVQRFRVLATHFPPSGGAPPTSAPALSLGADKLQHITMYTPRRFQQLFLMKHSVSCHVLRSICTTMRFARAPHTCRQTTSKKAEDAHPASCCWRHASNAATPYLTMKVLRKMVKNRTYLTVLLLINRRSRSPKMMGSDACR